MIASRSQTSILKELDQVTKMPNFKGYISDVGGPSANMYQMKGIDQSICDKCAAPSCIFPRVCRNLDTNPDKMTKIYKEISKHPDEKKLLLAQGFAMI